MKVLVIALIALLCNLGSALVCYKCIKTESVVFTGTFTDAEKAQFQNNAFANDACDGSDVSTFKTETCDGHCTQAGGDMKITLPGGKYVTVKGMRRDCTKEDMMLGSLKDKCVSDESTMNKFLEKAVPGAKVLNKVEMCSCKTEKCNGVGMVMASTMTTFLAPVVYFLFRL